MDLFNLTARLTLDTSDYEKNIEKAKQKGKEYADHTDKEVKTKSVLAWTAIITAVVALTKKLADLAKATIDYADQVGDLADKWGFATREIQEFDYWASLNGTTLEAMLSAMTRLTNQAQVNASAFKELGVSVKDENGNLKEQKQLFMEVATALNKIENQTQRNALQFDIFGRSGNEVAQVLKQGGEGLQEMSDEAERLGIILSERTIQKASDFNDEIDRLKAQGRSAFAELLAGADDADVRMEEFIKNLKSKIQQLAPVFRDIGTMLGQELIKGILLAIVDRLWGAIKFAVGEGWIWGERKVNNPLEYFQEMMTHSGGLTDTFSSISATTVNEKTTKVDETLDIRLSVESDGTVAGDKNLDTISDMLVDKINKALGDMVNG